MTHASFWNVSSSVRKTKTGVMAMFKWFLRAFKFYRSHFRDNHDDDVHNAILPATPNVKKENGDQI